MRRSAQNVDRTVTLYRAAKRTGRNLVVDLYAADVLARVALGSGVPHISADFNRLKVLITPGGKRMYARQQRDDSVQPMATSGAGVSGARIAGESASIMLRDSMLRDLEKGGLGFRDCDAHVFSNWSGYLELSDPKTA
ncbi:MAG: hypothetical protein ACOYLK_07450 [Sphingomonas sp.]